MKKNYAIILLVFSWILFGSTQSVYAQCSPGYSQIIINIVPDYYPNQTSWDIRDSNNAVVDTGAYIGDTICYPTGSLLHFTIYDNYGNGICCGGFGDGAYTVFLDGNLVAAGGPFGFSETTIINYPTGALSSVLQNDYQQLIDHCNNVTPLSPAQLNALAADIHLNRYYMADDLPVVSAAFDVIDCYDSNTGPLFLNTATTGSFPNAPGALDGFEYHRTIFSLQQDLFDVLFSKNRIAQHSGFLQGKKYLTADYFPGECPLPVDSEQTFTVTVNATMAPDWGRRTAWSQTAVRRPTGYYLSPGTIGKVKVPAAMVNAGYKILVGAHPHMNYTVHPTIKRFFDISNSYDITDTVTLIANPFGGGIYIVAPYLASLGLQPIELTNVVAAPFFSKKSWDMTTLNDWQTIQRNNPAPWADFESEKFMMQVPTSFIYDYNDPVTLMANWDARMDAVSNFLGYPLIRNNQLLYVMQDVDIMHGFYGIGFPQINNYYDPYSVQNGNSSMWFLDPLSFNEVEFHEMGHSHLFEKFPGEEEAAVNLLSAVVYNQVYGVDLDSAFGMSFLHSDWINRDLAAVNWMVTPNFRMGNPMDISNTTQDEVRYQHRGYGKYIEIAALFGMQVLNNYFYQINLDFNNNVPAGPLGEIDDRILKLSKAAGVDLRPLIHFWGVQPQDSAALALALDSNNLFASQLICDRLTHYLSLIPSDSAEFSQHAEAFFNGPVPPGGDPNYGNGWYNVWVPLYNNSQGDSAVIAMQHILDMYFPGGCQTVKVPEEKNSENIVSVFPNPSNGQFTVTLSEVNCELTITDMVGKQLLKIKPTEKTIKLQLSQNGAYVLYVKTDQGTIAKKLIVGR